MMDKLKEFFGSDHTTVVCTRTWDAWGVGTMTQDDFHNISEDEELLEDLANHLTTYPPGTKGLFWDDSGDHWYGTLKEDHGIKYNGYRFENVELSSNYQHFVPMEEKVIERIRTSPFINIKNAQ